MWTDAVLGGGLNNMLLHITQLLSESCGAHKVLLMPRLMADPIEYGFATFTMEAQHMASHVKEGKVSPPRSLAFSEVFDFGTFAREMRPCAVTEELPVGAMRVHINVSKLHDTKREGGGQPWYLAREYQSLLSRVYKAIRPSSRVDALVIALVREAERHVGFTWAAIHLPIERDWWIDSDYCKPRRAEGYTQRCFSPSQVAQVTRRSRLEHQTSGVVLLYAHDKVSTAYGPPVCFEDFERGGGNGTGSGRAVKLLLPREIDYTIRNAAEEFFAARAPGPFYGNSFSTFSKGVALLRHVQPRATRRHTTAPRSFAYDCALREYKGWDKELVSVSVAHPGFHRLGVFDTSREHRCRSTAAVRTSQI